ncbi:BMP family lipoprotein [Tengunoibacter tsumagoiensis]|uniref:BMP family ABC transporter substrate-binding protein n=1 Tax=Tengunoibacter tsumagoiensis TaxID=2014871 RepID=A0A402AAE3_9CHLR|nr:BMP family ABC transporter substrate-binding protein [Tengunoibacter tsumagoiensis]GCE15891.1 BMP family ABC transporter substrate-binding protein [Tengunoibacter tsumagoiensis]
MQRFGTISRVATLLGIACTLLLAGCGSTSSPTTPSSAKKVTLITDIGGLNDQGFNQLSYQGYKKALDKYGFTRSVIETKSQDQYVSELTQAAQNSDLVIGVGFLMANAMDQVAKANPNKSFALIDACPAKDASGACDNLPNVAPLFFKEQEAGCLVGAMAAQMELDGKAKVSKLLGQSTIGAVGGLEIPPVQHYIAGYQYCAQQVDPAVKVVINYAQSFEDTTKCNDAATSQINQHQADIIFQVAGGCGIGALAAAKDKGVYGIGVDSDQSQINGNVITSAVKRLDTAVYDTISDFQAGKFTATPPTFDLKMDGVGYGTVSSDVPADAKAKADEYAQKIKDGSLTVPDSIKG